MEELINYNNQELKLTSKIILSKWEKLGSSWVRKLDDKNYAEINTESRLWFYFQGTKLDSFSYQWQVVFPNEDEFDFPNVLEKAMEKVDVYLKCVGQLKAFR